MQVYFLKTGGLLFNRLVAFEANQGVTLMLGKLNPVNHIIFEFLISSQRIRILQCETSKFIRTLYSPLFGGLVKNQIFKYFVG